MYKKYQIPAISCADAVVLVMALQPTQVTEHFNEDLQRKEKNTNVLNYYYEDEFNRQSQKALKMLK